MKTSTAVVRGPAERRTAKAPKPIHLPRDVPVHPSIAESSDNSCISTPMPLLAVLRVPIPMSIELKDASFHLSEKCLGAFRRREAGSGKRGKRRVS